MFNRILAIIAVVFLGVLLLRAEMRMDIIEEKLDDIIHTTDKVNYTPKDVECLTKNIYYEAGVEDHRGKYAVAHVTVNRLKAGYWGNSICKVVYAKSQFSWTLAKKLPRPNSRLWAESEAIARSVLAGYRVRGLQKSLYYHATYIKDPKWVDTKHEAGQIGKHIFYNRAKNSGVMI